LSKVRRRLVWEGDEHVVECAVRADKITSPASDFLDHLKQGAWTEDPDFTDLPDDAQIAHHDKFLVFCRILAETGLPCYRGAVNDLRDGVWEFKLGAKRMSFFDTHGDGTYEPKLRPANASEALPGEFYWFPYFDDYIRLGHAFPKTGQKTTEEDIDLTLTVREEDVEHDRTA
jgi:hypothetical protein